MSDGSMGDALMVSDGGEQWSTQLSEGYSGIE